MSQRPALPRWRGEGHGSYEFHRPYGSHGTYSSGSPAIPARLGLLALLALLLPFSSLAAPTVLLVVGAPGEAEFGTNFVHQAARWQETCRRAGLTPLTVGLDATPSANPASATNDLDQLRHVLEVEPHEGLEPFWLVLIGHGTFDGKEAKFNLRGPDLTATDLAVALSPFRRPTVLLNTASASAPFLPKLAATNRVVLVATRSGYEQNFTRLGSHLADTIADPRGDLDQDGQTSLLEAFLAAAARTAEFYQTEGRMLTEHALLDDNGDGLGTPAEWFRGLRATKRPKDGAALDGLRAHQLHLVPSPADAQLPPETRAHRDDLERRVAALRDQRASLPEADYFARLESILLELARLGAGPAAKP